MTTMTASQARIRLYQLLDETAKSHKPVQITGRRSDAVLISADDWKDIQETLYLVSIPGIRESVIKGLKEPLSKTSGKLKW